MVPYSLYLTCHFKAHINVEFYRSVQAIKCIHKYIYKSSDCATILVNIKKDEIAQYLQERYIGPTKAMWQIFEFLTHEKKFSVKQLAIHLSREQFLYFEKNIIVAEL